MGTDEGKTNIGLTPEEALTQAKVWVELLARTALEALESRVRQIASELHNYARHSYRVGWVDGAIYENEKGPDRLRAIEEANSESAETEQ